MANLTELQDFASVHGFDLTRPLTASQVERLARNWLPDIRFYEEEKFHPISLDETLTIVEDLFDQLPDTAKDQWRVNLVVRDSLGMGELRAFDPPVVHDPDGVAFVDGLPVPAVKILNHSTPANDGLDDHEADANTVVTHGASYTRSNQFFGGSQTLAGGSVASAGDPYLPRATGQDGLPRITIHASFKHLLETFKYELLVEESGNYPPDALRGGFAIESLLIRSNGTGLPFSNGQRRRILLDIISAHETGNGIGPALDRLPTGWYLDESTWDALTRYSFLEYDFFYAYNDFDRYQTTPFENEHEGDNEGCCLVFDRNVINLAATTNNVLQAVPEAIIASVHEESQDADLLKFLTPPVVPSNDPQWLPRSDMDLVVYIAAGSHATYFTPGNHDLVDFGDVIEYANDASPLLIVLFPGAVLSLAILVTLVDYFVDTEDKTSDDGIRTGPEDIVGDHVTAVASEVKVLPMSGDEHIYDANHTDLLRLHSFAGKWGGHDGVIDKSPAYTTKTGRYFRKLLSRL